MTLSIDQPFHVAMQDGTFVDGYETQAEAEASCVERNQRAEKLGVAARYVVIVGTRRSATEATADV